MAIVFLFNAGLDTAAIKMLQVLQRAIASVCLADYSQLYNIARTKLPMNNSDPSKNSIQKFTRRIIKKFYFYCQTNICSTS